MKQWLLFSTGFLIYIISLFVTAPATLIDSQLQNFSDNQLHLVEAQGTLWSGKGKIEMLDASGQAALIKKVAWRFQAKELWRAHLVYEVNFNQDSYKPFPLTLSWSKIELENIEFNLPAEIVGLGLPKIAALGLTGDVFIHILNLSITGNKRQGIASLQWQHAGSTLTPVSPLGDYELYIEEAGSATHSTLRTTQGPLQLDGKGSWGDGQTSGFLATAHIAPAFQQQLAPFLRLIAVEHGDGSFELQLN